MIGRVLRQPLLPRTVPPLPLLLLVTMTGTVGVHIFLPAVPAAGSDLHASAAAAQLTITLYIAGLAVGQLVYGPLSDRFGRRPVILCAMALYLAGLLLAIPATGIGTLIAARLIQSLGACGPLVLGRAMVRDVSSREDSARKLAALVTAMTLTPAIAPALGGVISDLFGWRSIFVVLASAVGLLVFAVLLILPETNRRPAASIAVGSILANYARLLRSAKFRNYMIAASAGGTSLYAFLSAAPFLLIEVLGRTPKQVGIYCLLASAGMAVGSMSARQLVGRLEIRHAARIGALICAGSGALLLLLNLLFPLSVPTLIGPVFLYSIGIGVGSPNALAGLMNVDPEAAGSASSLYGCVQMSVGTLASLSVAVWNDGTAFPVSVLLLCFALTGLAALQRV